MNPSQMPLYAISYNAAISACEKGRQWEQALALLQEMARFGLQADVSQDGSCGGCSLFGRTGMVPRSARGGVRDNNILRSHLGSRWQAAGSSPWGPVASMRRRSCAETKRSGWHRRWENGPALEDMLEQRSWVDWQRQW